AGKGTRLRPFTYTTSKPMIRVAGKPILGHLLDSLSTLKIDKAIFIVSEDNNDLKKFIKKNYSFEAAYILQKDQKGVAHAIYGAKSHVVDDEIIILFADTLIKADLKKIHKNKDLDGIIWTKQVDDPRSYGVVFTHNGIISNFIEKPETPVSDNAIVGLYYFKKSNKLFAAIEHLLKNEIKTKGEFQLTDALQLL
ncbi:MAG: nucleotidyltransferase family protein, partial [Flavobacteriales bacterium]|nr:nucleotidyltransferase family protein [Flavobacteriales bacterium]